MVNETKFLEAVKKLREENKKERKFDQTVDIIVNLKEFDVRKQAFNVFASVPNKIKDKKIAGFFEKDNNLIDSIKKDNFIKYKEKKDAKKLIKNYDFFIANAKLMPAVATSFGRILGPVGKMPSPQLGILPNEEEAVVKAIVERVNKSVRIIVKEPSIKVGIAKISLDDDKIVENLVAVYGKILESLPKGIDNIRNVKVKLTMSKPVGVDLK
jgi:large subunit ribosomal protein L1